MRLLLREYLLGIDAGTSRLKAVLFDVHGKEVAAIGKENQIIGKNGNWVEQDMNQLWFTLASMIRTLLKNQHVDPSQIKGIGITGQGEGCWLADQNGRPVRPAILWSDGRAVRMIAEIKENTEIRNTIKQITGSFPYAGATSILLKWLKDHQPEVFKQAHYCFFCKDWLRFKLTGNANLELTDASASLVDLKKRTISASLFHMLDIPEAIGLFPNVLKPHELAGYITPEAALETGLQAGTPVCAGMIDIAANTVGTGTIQPHDISTILGTTCSNQIVADHAECFSMEGAGTQCYIDDHLYLHIVASMSGTPNLDWFIRNYCQEERNEAMQKRMDIFRLLENEIKAIPPGSGGVIYHPYISPSGERAPMNNPNAKAQFFGISSQTTKHHMLRAIYEGVALSIKDCLTEVKTKRKIILAGGGAKSAVWSQMIADCTGTSVSVLQGNEHTAKGAALAAGVCIGIYPDFRQAACQTVREQQVFYPDPQNAARYDEMYSVYTQVRTANAAAWDLRSKIQW
ncbi:FGGY-family carbohydrate kinase [Brevibacillus sp. NRS-1366]|uniref:FGGY-family carbohydrate kinase n=1 Tax=Brevibacillus sp. NRS-1366 TaxID=3233899 RepID=UPI003D23D345